MNNIKRRAHRLLCTEVVSADGNMTQLMATRFATYWDGDWVKHPARGTNTLDLYLDWWRRPCANIRPITSSDRIRISHLVPHLTSSTRSGSLSTRSNKIGAGNSYLLRNTRSPQKIFLHVNGSGVVVNNRCRTFSRS